MPSPTDRTWPTSATSASLPKLAICCFRIAEISAARISISVPLPDAFHCQLQAPQPALQRAIDHARTDLDDHPAQQAWIDAQIGGNASPERAAQLLAEGVLLCLVQRLRGGHFGGYLAAPLGELIEIGLDHRRHREQPPITGDHPKEIAGQIRQSGALAERGDRFRLILAR